MTFHTTHQQAVQYQRTAVKNGSKKGEKSKSRLKDKLETVQITQNTVILSETAHGQRDSDTT